MNSELNKLLSIIETSKESNTRIKGIRRILNHKSEKAIILDFLENIIVSDTDFDVRLCAFRTFKKIDTQKLVYPVIFLIKNESIPFLLELFSFLSDFHPLLSSKMLKWKLKKEDYMKGINIDALSLQKLKEIICNMVMDQCQDMLYFHRHSIPLALDTYGF